MPDKINIVSPDGRVIQGTEEELKRLQLLGNYQAEDVRDTRYRRGEAQTETDYSTLTDKATTFAHGLASGATVGLSDYVLNDDEEDLRAKYNPGSRLAGEVVGAVGASVAVPMSPAGLVTRGAEAAGARVAAAGAKTAGKVLTGVIEGAGAGLQAEISNAQLSNDPLTTEAVVHGLGMGALFGGGLTAGLHYGGKGLEKIGQKLEQKPELVTKSITDEIQIINEENFTPFRESIRGTTEIEKTLQGRIDDELDRLTAATKEVEASGGMNGQRIGVSSAEPVVATETKVTAAEAPVKGPDIKTAHQQLTDVASELESYAPISQARDAAKSVKSLKTAARAASEAIKGGDPTSALKALEKFREAVKSTASTLDYKIADEVGAIVDKAATTTDQDIAQVLSSKKKRASPIGDIRQKNAQDIAAEKLKREQMRTNLLGDELSVRQLRVDAQRARYIDTVKNATGTTVEPYVRTQAAVKELRNFPNTAKEFAGMQTAKAEKVFAAIDHVMSQNLPELLPLQQSIKASIDSLAQGAGIRVEGGAVKQLREIQKIAHTANTIKIQKEVDELVFRDKATAHKSKAVGLGEDYMRYKTGQYFASQGGSGMAGYFMGSRLVGMGIDALAGVRGAVQQRLSTAAKAVGKAFQSSRTKYVAPRLEPLYTKLDGSRDPEKNVQKAARNRITEMMETAPHVRNVLFKSVEPLVGGNNNDLAVALLDTAEKSFNAVLELLPKPMTNVISKFKSTWEPTPTEALVTAKVLDAFFNPLEVIDRALTGTIDAIQMEVLQACMPELVQECRSEVLMNADFENMSYADQEAMSRFLGQPVSSQFDPMNILDAQSSHNKIPSAPQFNPQGTGMSSGGRPSSVEAPTPAQQNVGKWM